MELIDKRVVFRFALITLITLVTVFTFLPGCASTQKYLGAETEKIEPKDQVAWVLFDFVPMSEKAVVERHRGWIAHAFGPATYKKEEEYHLSQFNFVEPKDEYYERRSGKLGSPILIPRFTKIQIKKEITIEGISSTVTEFEADGKTYHGFHLHVRNGRTYHDYLSAKYPKEEIAAAKAENDAVALRRKRIGAIKSGPNSKFYEAVTKRQIEIGMPEELLILSWGEPEKINETNLASGVHKQYVYGRRLVYVVDGKITAWQTF